MRRIIVVVVVLAVVLTGLIAVRLNAQEAQLRGPSGGSGEIEGIELRLAAKLSARIEQVHVAEGASVKKGELLVTLDCAEPRAMVAEAEARLASAQAQGRAAVAAAEASEGALGAAQSATEASRAQTAALAAQRDAAKRQAKRLEEIGTYVAESNRDQVEASAAGLEHQVEAAQASSQASSAQARAAVRQAHAARATADAAQAAATAAEAALERARLLVAECEVRAPRDAFVEELPFEPGELVGPGSPLVRLVDLATVKATFYLPNAELATARPGAEAVVVADAWPDRQFKGTVQTVALTAEFTPRNIQTRTDRDRLVYPVEVLLANPGLELRPGMPVQVTLPGTER